MYFQQEGAIHVEGAFAFCWLKIRAGKAHGFSTLGPEHTKFFLPLSTVVIKRPGIVGGSFLRTFDRAKPNP